MGFPPGEVPPPPPPPEPPPGPDDPAGTAQRQQIAQAMKAAVAANQADIAQADTIIAESTNPAIVALAQHSKAQARQLNALIRLVGWLAAKSDSAFDRSK